MWYIWGIYDIFIERNKDLVIVGDLNIDFSRESVYKRRKIECRINDNGLKQLIKD